MVMTLEMIIPWYFWYKYYIPLIRPCEGMGWFIYWQRVSGIANCTVISGYPHLQCYDGKNIIDKLLKMAGTGTVLWRIIAVMSWDYADWSSVTVAIFLCVRHDPRSLVALSSVSVRLPWCHVQSNCVKVIVTSPLELSSLDYVWTQAAMRSGVKWFLQSPN